MISRLVLCSAAVFSLILVTAVNSYALDPVELNVSCGDTLSGKSYSGTAAFSPVSSGFPWFVLRHEAAEYLGSDTFRIFFTTIRIPRVLVSAKIRRLGSDRIGICDLSVTDVAAGGSSEFNGTYLSCQPETLLGVPLRLKLHREAEDGTTSQLGCTVSVTLAPVTADSSKGGDFEIDATPTE